MSDSSSEKNLSYQDVAKIADVILKSGKKVRIDEVREEVGYGDYAQIASFLRKWQSQSSDDKTNDRPQHKIAPKEHNNRQKQQKQNTTNKFYQYDDASSYTFHSDNTPFCLEKFLEESDAVKSLFLAICYVRQARNEVVEEMRKLKANALSFYKQSDRDIRRIKMAARDQVKALNSECTRIHVFKEQEINKLKEKTS